jgi:hypothetical protein
MLVGWDKNFCMTGLLGSSTEEMSSKNDASDSEIASSLSSATAARSVLLRNMLEDSSPLVSVEDDLFDETLLLGVADSLEETLPPCTALDPEVGWKFNCLPLPLPLLLLLPSP